MSTLVLIANAVDGTISSLRLYPADDAHPARLELLATSGDLPGCGTFAIDRTRHLVYAAYKGASPGIATLSLDRNSATLTELARRNVADKLTYLDLANNGTTLLGVSYSGGTGTTWPLTATGEVKNPLSHCAFNNLHCIVATDNHAHQQQYAYAVSLGDDLIAQFALTADGRLIPLDPPTVACPPGSGPRHLIIDGDNAYLMTEYSGDAIRFARTAAGRLQLLESINVVDPSSNLHPSSFGADPTSSPLIWGADIHTGRGYLLTSERNSSQLTVTSLDDGKFGAICGFTSTETQPRGFGISPCGRYVVAVGEKSTHAQLLELHRDGRLEPAGRTYVGHGANWVRFV